MISASSQLRVDHLLLAKTGSTFAECEDAIGINAAAGRFAVADGATEAFDAGRWAHRLADQWVRDETDALTIDGFRAWVAEQGAALHQTWEGKPLPWYAEEKARRGSFAAFVGVEFAESADDCAGLRWRALALGDACLIVRRGREVRAAVPLADAQSFHSCPPLVPSRVAEQEAAFAAVRCDSGALLTGDVCWLLSDAVAAWCLRAQGDAAERFDEFESLLVTARRDNLVELFAAERRAARLRDDDYAAVRIAFERRP